jgi:phospholipid-transporting ATPase
MVINNTLIDVLQVEKWVAVPWKKLQVGDIIRVSVLTFVVISL